MNKSSRFFPLSRRLLVANNGVGATWETPFKGLGHSEGLITRLVPPAIGQFGQPLVTFQPNAFFLHISYNSKQGFEGCIGVQCLSTFIFIAIHWPPASLAVGEGLTRFIVIVCSIGSL